ncbi:hypothetical protein QJS10_CPB11g01516 [Acorus calamus]|uniref:Small auxin up regulated protein n=1 Tax=Acorus calamus TaxID=4465 RepID=A0AAV9DS60_ACOCL|nr:hypothetical protein QJS10_CPB11g01516 [Acorus calamus]
MRRCGGSGDRNRWWWPREGRRGETKWDHRLRESHACMDVNNLNVNTPIKLSIDRRRSNEDQDAWVYDMEGCMRNRSRPSFYAPSADESHGQGVRAPKGYVPVIVGRGREEETVFVVHTKLFNHPSFVAMLERASEEVGYEHQGMIRVSFDVQHFQMTVNLILEDD